MTSRSCPDHGLSMALGQRDDELPSQVGEERWHWICPAGHTHPADEGEEPVASDPRIVFRV